MIVLPHHLEERIVSNPQEPSDANDLHVVLVEGKPILVGEHGNEIPPPPEELEPGTAPSLSRERQLHAAAVAAEDRAWKELARRAGRIDIGPRA
jgi:hypothetical protein